jgi:adenine-specific DNA-methyltransferase
MAGLKKLELKSKNITEGQKAKLKELFPEVFREDKIDFDKLRLTLGSEVDDGEERFGMTWPGKHDCFKVIQEPSIGTLKPCRDKSVNWDKTENLFIEGDNLEALKLLQKSYYGKIKMIYIDPPYNTGNEFIYPDKYSESLETYLAYTGQVDDEGRKFSTNTEADGRFHSKWLNMMYPRLFLARNLLRDDGVIFISIDDNEVKNLRTLCDEIFGEENFVADLVWKKRVSPANDSQWYSSDHEYLCVYAKVKEKWNPNKTKRTEEHNKYYKNPDNDPRGLWNSAAYTCNKSKSERPNLYYPILNPNTGEEIWPNENAAWAYSKETHLEHVKANILYWGADGKAKSPRKKQYLTEAKPVVPRSVWDYQEVGSTQTATTESRNLFGGASFSYPKAVGLLKKAIYQSTVENDIVVDFFAGSCTTAHAALDLNKEDACSRKFIMVQLPEPCNKKSEAFKAGYKTIADIGKERIRRVIKKINKKKEGKLDFGEPKQDLGFKVFKLDKSNFKIWDGSIAKMEKLQTNRFRSSLSLPLTILTRIAKKKTFSMKSFSSPVLN